MARDIAAMKEKGIGGVMHMQTINAGGLPVPQQPKMLDADWSAWFGEMLRLGRAGGMALSASILDGWSHGGWWVGKEDGAKQLVYSETQVEGPAALSTPLPQPHTRLGIYRDVAIVAFREKTARPPLPMKATANNVNAGYCDEENWPADHAIDGDPSTYWRTQRSCSPESPAILELQYARPIRIVSALVAGMSNAGPAEGEIQVSGDGKTFLTVCDVRLGPGEAKRVTFSETEGSVFRLLVRRAHSEDLQLAEFQLLRRGDEPVWRRGIKWWEFKSANRAWWQWPPNPYEALEEEHTGDEVSDLESAGVVDLTTRLAAGGLLDWEVPAGRWTVLRFGWTPLAEPARMGSGGYEVDVLNTKGADLMMDSAAQRMRELSVKHAGGAPILFHTDSWEIGAGGKGQQPTWTDDLRDQFRKRRGYDLLPYFPALARRVIESRETTDRFLRDYRDTVADLLADYYGRLQERARELGGGINSESGYGSYPHPHMDGLKVFGRADRPMAEFWHPFGQYSPEFLEQVDVMRTTASGARIYGRRYVQAETLTYHPTAGLFTPPAQYRRTLHEAWARGLNQAVIHKYTHQPLDHPPGMLDYDIVNRHFSWWPLADGFLGYMGRCQYLLQQGEFVADVLFFVGEGASRFVPGREYLRPMLPPGYDYDGVNAEVLLTRLSVRDGWLCLPPCAAGPGAQRGEGLRYRYLVLCEPQCRALSPAVLEKVRDLVLAGAALVGAPPQAAPGLTDRASADARVKTLVAELWGAALGGQGERKVGLGRVIWGKPLETILREDAVKPDVETVPGEWGQLDAGKARRARLAWIHRRVSDADIYFLANPLKQSLDLTVTLRSRLGRVRLFDPLDGTVWDLCERQFGADGRASIPLHFEPEQAYFVVVSQGPENSSARRNFPRLSPLVEIAGPWRVTFDADRVKPLPASVEPGAKFVETTLDRLMDWSRHPEEGVKSYSGVATYEAVFDVSGSSDGGRVFVDVGEVKEMARVSLNGRDLGVVWCPPWRVKIPAGLLRGKGNEIRIAVANTWHNRLAADHALPNGERLARVGHGLSQVAAQEGIQPAGLLGPVRVLVER
jgi:hypothetical protein